MLTVSQTLAGFVLHVSVPGLHVAPMVVTDAESTSVKKMAYIFYEYQRDNVTFLLVKDTEFHTFLLDSKSVIRGFILVYNVDYLLMLPCFTYFKNFLNA